MSGPPLRRASAGSEENARQKLRSKEINGVRIRDAASLDPVRFGIRKGRREALAEDENGFPSDCESGTGRKTHSQTEALKQ